MTRTIRAASPDDLPDVAAITADIWPDRPVGDYVTDVFEAWATSEDPDERCLVAEVDGTVVGLCHAATCTDDEGWLEGIRVHPEHRGAGHGSALTAALLDWCRERGATVARNLVHAWNEAGMGQSRALGFDPVTTCRWATPEPADATVPAGVVDDPAAAWRYWTDSDTRTHLGGLAIDPGRTWTFSELTRAQLRDQAETQRVLALVDGGVRGMAVRTRTVELGAHDGDGERDDVEDDKPGGAGEDGNADDAADMAGDGAADGCDGRDAAGTETLAEYGVAAWADADAGRRVLDAIRADAAAIDTDATRVWVPETARYLSDVAAAGAALSDDAMVVLAADLTGRD